MKFSPEFKTVLDQIDTGLDSLIQILPDPNSISLVSEQNQYTASDIQYANSQISQIVYLFDIARGASTQLKALIASLEV